jgi:hypothetical protein
MIIFKPCFALIYRENHLQRERGTSAVKMPCWVLDVRRVVFVLELLCICWSVVAVEFEGRFDSRTFSASSSSEAQLGAVLAQFFSWGDNPIFTTFQGVNGPSSGMITIDFGFGSPDPTANEQQIKYTNDLASYLQATPNATLLRGALNNAGIQLLALVLRPTTSTPQPPAADDSVFGEYLPAVIVGGVVLGIIAIGAIAFIVAKRRASHDDRIFDAMEAMMDEEGDRATRGVEGIQPSTLPAPASSTTRSPAPPPRQVV